MGVLTALSLLAVCAVLIGTALVPQTWMRGCVLVCAGGGASVGAMAAMRGVDRRGILWGVFTGGLMAALLLVSGLLLYSEVNVSWGTAVAVACVSGGGATGVFLGKHKKKRRG